MADTLQPPVPRMVPYLEAFFVEGSRESADVWRWLHAGNMTATGSIVPERQEALNWLIAQDIVKLHYSITSSVYTFYAMRMDLYRQVHNYPPVPAYIPRPRDPSDIEQDAEELAKRMYEAVSSEREWIAADAPLREQWKGAAAKVLREHLYDNFDWA